ncbi:Hypothetical protein NGAL_HAMBI1189_45860 [Neorhizobium galegae bv. officinalis]|uniref:Uncharacterized protein n=1 Tax=Neorhizobium galegae bv. officinalis TaxID=323656 RepID=A0A0T7GZC6_NEOGA|nr:Hypothetical protein NGAL_HAMBI1189_45860 [Neorhizobium galegae bv. officinalis]
MVTVLPRIPPPCPAGHLPLEDNAPANGACGDAAILTLPLVGRVAGRREGFSFRVKSPLPNPSPQGGGAPRTPILAVVRRPLAVILGLDPRIQASELYRLDRIDAFRHEKWILGSSPRMTGTELGEMPGRAEGGTPRTWSVRS